MTPRWRETDSNFRSHHYISSQTGARLSHVCQSEIGRPPACRAAAAIAGGETGCARLAARRRGTVTGPTRRGSETPYKSCANLTLNFDLPHLRRQLEASRDYVFAAAGIPQGAS